MVEVEEIEAPTSTPDATSAPPEPAPVAEPAPAADDDSLERYLREYDEATSRAAPEPIAPESAASEPSLDQLLANYDRDRQFEQLQSQLGRAQDAIANARAAYEAEAWRANEIKELDEHCSRVQERLPDYMPDDYAKAELLAMARTDPRLEIAWQARNTNPVACRVELEKVDAAWRQLKMNPISNPQQIAALEQWGAQLQVALHAKRILRQAEEAVVEKAARRSRSMKMRRQIGKR